MGKNRTQKGGNREQERGCSGGSGDRDRGPGHGEQPGLFPNPAALSPVPVPAAALSPFPVPWFPPREKPLTVVKRSGVFHREAGDGLLSRALSGGVPSALQGLTAVFGMGTGVAPAL